MNALLSFETLRKDISFAVRTLKRSLSVTAAVILTLMFGIGANTALFSVIYSVLLKPLPYPHPDRLVFMAELGLTDAVGVIDFLYWRNHARSFESLAAFALTDQTLTGDGDAVPVRVVMFSGSLTRIFGVLPSLGRDFLPEEIELRQDGPPRRVALISGRFFRQRFGGDAAALGKMIVMDNAPFIVIGVLPPSFRFQPPSVFGTQREADAIVNMPFHLARFRGRGPALVQVLGRLKAAVKLKTARAELETIRADIAKQYPGDPKRELRMMPLHERIVGSTRLALLMLWVAVGFVVLVACVNVANLMLTKASVRSRETAIRAAVGASRSRLIRQLLTESMLLAFTAGAAGIGLAFWISRLIVTKSAIDVPGLKDTALDWNVLVYCFALCAVTGILSGLVPAWAGSRTNLGGMLKEGNRTATLSGRRHYLHGLLVVTELALALMLLSGAGLMLRSLWVIRSQTAAFAPELVLTTFINSRQMARPADQARYVEDLVRDIESLPGVRAAAASGCGAVPFEISGLPAPPPDKQVGLGVPCVSLHYPAALGLRLLAGRWLGEQDREHAPPVAVVNEATERIYTTLFPSSGPIIGRRINTGGPPAEFPTVVGIASDFRSTPDADPEPQAFLPAAQSPFNGLATLLVRASSDPAAMAGSIRKIVGRTPGVSMVRPETLEDQLLAAIAPRRFQAVLLLSFAALALLLATLGLYGVQSYAVTQRTHEIGVRMALGASHRNVVSMVLARAAKLIFAGVALGLVGSVSLTRLMGSLLYGVKSTDAWTYALVCLLLVAVAMLATYLPARRAVRVDPAVALRYE